MTRSETHRASYNKAVPVRLGCNRHGPLWRGRHRRAGTIHAAIRPVHGKIGGGQVGVDGRRRSVGAIRRVQSGRRFTRGHIAVRLRLGVVGGIGSKARLGPATQVLEERHC